MIFYNTFPFSFFDFILDLKFIEKYVFYFITNKILNNPNQQNGSLSLLPRRLQAILQWLEQHTQVLRQTLVFFKKIKHW